MLHGVPTSFKKDSVPAAHARLPLHPLPSCSGPTLPPPPGRGAPDTQGCGWPLHCPQLCLACALPKEIGRSSRAGAVQRRGISLETGSTRCVSMGSRHEKAGGWAKGRGPPGRLFPGSTPAPHVRQRPARGQRTILL